MKTWKKLLALLLALAMVFAFAACGGNNDDDDDDDDDKKGSSSVQETKPKDPKPETTKPEVTEPEVTEPDIYGEWVMAFNINEYLNSVVIGETEIELSMPETQVDMDMIFEIDEDGDFDWYYQVDADALEDYCDEATVIAKDFFIAFYAEQNLTEADLEASFGMPVIDYAEYIVYTAASSVMDEFEAMSMAGYCKINGDKLMVSQDEEELEETTDSFVFAVDGDQLTVSQMEGEGSEIAILMLEGYGAKLPWVFERQ